MGLRYTFVVICAADAVDAVLHAVARRATRSGLDAALPWRPAREAEGVRAGIAGLADRCVAFDVPRDPAADVLERGGLGPDVREIRVGCVYLDVIVGRRFALVQGTAATSDLSRYFRDSAAMRAVWREAAREAGALAVVLDCEGEPWQLLFPRAALLRARPEEDESLDLYAFHDLLYHPDRLAAVVLGEVAEQDPGGSNNR